MIKFHLEWLSFKNSPIKYKEPPKKIDVLELENWLIGFKELSRDGQNTNLRLLGRSFLVIEFSSFIWTTIIFWKCLESLINIWEYLLLLIKEQIKENFQKETSYLYLKNMR